MMVADQDTEFDPAVGALESKYFDIAAQFDRLGYPARIVIADDPPNATVADLTRVQDDGAYPGEAIHRWGIHAWDFGYGGAEVLIMIDCEGEPRVRQIDGPDFVNDLAVHSALKIARRALNPPPKPQDKPKEFKLPTVYPSQWHGLKVPEREWWLPDIIPSRTVSLLSGNGGVGKSLLALQLGAAAALGIDTAGLSPSPGRCLYLGAEDEADEFHRRLLDICTGAGRTLADLGDRFLLVPMAGKNALLCAPHGAVPGALVFTSVWRELEKRIQLFQPGIVVLDTSADLFGGNEIDRLQVRWFIGMLRELAQEHDCAILLLSHPSLEGIKSGSGLSGSTAWHNSVRGRLYLEHGDPDDKRARVLSVKKQNYSEGGDSIKLRWDAGLFIADDGSTPIGGALMANHADRVFLSVLEKMVRQGQSLSPNPSQSYAPKVIAKHPDASGIGLKPLAAAMQRLLDSGIVQIIEEGSPSRRYKRLVPTSMIHPGYGGNRPSN